MTAMNDNEKRTGPVEDHRSKPRWSANKKMDAELRIARGTSDNLRDARARTRRHCPS